MPEAHLRLLAANREVLHFRPSFILLYTSVISQLLGGFGAGVLGTADSGLFWLSTGVLVSSGTTGEVRRCSTTVVECTITSPGSPDSWPPSKMSLIKSRIPSSSVCALSRHLSAIPRIRRTASFTCLD